MPTEATADQPDETPPDEMTESEAREISEATEFDYAKLSMERLATAIAYVEGMCPPYNMRCEEMHEVGQDQVPATIERARQRSLVAAFGLIAREFDATMGRENF